jgi:hypothetical protein
MKLKRFSQFVNESIFFGHGGMYGPADPDPTGPLSQGTAKRLIMELDRAGFLEDWIKATSSTSRASLDRKDPKYSERISKENMIYRLADAGAFKDVYGQSSPAFTDLVYYYNSLSMQDKSKVLGMALDEVGSDSDAIAAKLAGLAAKARARLDADQARWNAPRLARLAAKKAEKDSAESDDIS